jgi:hypothetical protein
MILPDVITPRLLQLDSLNSHLNGEVSTILATEPPRVLPTSAPCLLSAGLTYTE